MVTGAGDIRVEAAVKLLVSTNLGTCGHRELDVLAGALQRVRGFVAAYDVQLTRRRDEVISELSNPSGHAAGAGGEPTSSPEQPTSSPIEGPDDAAPPGPSTHEGMPLDLSGFEGGRDRRPGREVEQDRTRTQVCSLLPMFEAALAEGRIDVAHVDAVAAAWRDLDESERAELAEHGESLLGYAETENPERFRRRARDLARQIARDHGVRVAERQRAQQQVRRWTDRRTGMGHLHVELDPENTARVWAAIDERLAAFATRGDNAGVPLNRLEVDALVELITTSSALDPRSPEICVLVDLATARSGVFGPGSICETSDGTALTPAAVRRLACEAGILPVVLGGDGVPLDVGRSRRLATREQRRALAGIYTSCGMPGCSVRFERCRIHHLDPWLPSGPTDLDNLIPICSRHHHQVHEGGCTLTMTPDRVITLRSPDGTIQFHGNTRDRIGADLFDEEIGRDDDGRWPDQEQLVHAARTRTAELTRHRCRSNGARSGTGTRAGDDQRPHHGSDRGAGLRLSRGP